MIAVGGTVFQHSRILMTLLLARVGYSIAWRMLGYSGEAHPQMRGLLVGVPR